MTKAKAKAIIENKTKKDDIVIIEEPKKEPKKEEVKIEDEVTLVQNNTKPIEPKNVRVVLNKNHKCHIGGNWYSFERDKQYNVPENVKSVLRKAGLLSAL